MNTLKILAIFTYLSFHSIFSYSQLDNVLTFYSGDEATISATKTSCIDRVNDIHNEYFIMEINNKSDKELEISYKMNLWYDNDCLTCDSESGEYQHMIKISPNTTIKGSCDKRHEKSLLIFSKMYKIKTKELTNAELSDLKIIASN
jgi:uncharacterized protein YcfL